MRLPLTVKMLLIFSFLFAVSLLGYAIYVIHFVAYIDTPEGFFSRFLVISVLVVSLSIVAFTVLVGVLSSFMVRPIRKITKEIDTITAEDLSARIEAVDSQDELTELTNRINDMLSKIEETFVRQENFVADASHELKTPITVIAGYVNLLKRWGSKDKVILEEGIEALGRESNNMQRIVEQLLLLAKIGKINLSVTKFCADSVLAEVVESYRLIEHGRIVEYHGLGEKLILSADKNLLVELVRILTDNAIKYTQKDGRIVVSSRLAEEGSIFEIRVEDNGIGIAEEDLPKIYDRFFRCDKARGRESGSSGLGLTIAKSIVETLGGEIVVASKLGKGSAFTFRYGL